VSLPVDAVYKEGYDLVTEIPKYDNVKSRLCQEQRKSED
jgi:hypothetical protein